MSTYLVDEPGINQRSGVVSSIVNLDQSLDLDHFYQPSVIQLAREGDFRAIAYWLNGYLIPHGIYARVEAAQPGCLQVWIECYRVPQPDRLIRYICYRLCKLNSPIIRGARIATCLAGTAQVQWERSVRIVSPAQKTYHRLRKTVPTPDWAKLSAQTTLQLKLALQDYRQHPYSRLLTRSAIAAFVIGCSVEAINFRPTSTLTSQREIGSRTQLVTASDRPEQVAAALELVNVISHPGSTTDPAVTLAFGGDNALGRGTPDQGNAVTQDEYESGGLARYRQADVALTQLSRPLALPAQRRADGEPNPSIQALTDREVDIVTLANAQLAESGLGELRQTLNQLEQAGIHSVGAGRNQREARRPQILDVKGQRIAYLGYSDSDANAARARAAGVNFGTDEQISADIQALRDQVDWIIVNYHWSQDLAEYPGEHQMHLAHLAIDQGADLVVGHHPEVLQGAEIYKGRAIAYSLGNFIFAHQNSADQDGASPDGADQDSASQDSENQNRTAQSDYDTALLKVSLGAEQMRLEFLPVQVRQSQPAIVSGKEGEAVLRYLEQASGLFEQPMRSPMTLDARPAEETEPSRPMPFEEAGDPFLKPLNTPTGSNSQLEDRSEDRSTDASDDASDAWEEDTFQWSQPDALDSFITYPDEVEAELELELNQENLDSNFFTPEDFPEPPADEEFDSEQFDSGQIEVQPVATALSTELSIALSIPLESTLHSMEPLKNRQGITEESLTTPSLLH